MLPQPRSAAAYVVRRSVAASYDALPRRDHNTDLSCDLIISLKGNCSRRTLGGAVE